MQHEAQLASRSGSAANRSRRLARGAALLGSFCIFAAAQIPAQDARNTDIPGTNTHFKMPVYKTRAEWEARKEHLRYQILSAAGLLPMPARAPLHPLIFGRLERNGYTIEKVALETLPGYYLAGNLYRPRTPGKHPGLVSPHGHWTYGRLENSDRASVPQRCMNLARLGFVVFAYDMVGYDDTTQTTHGFGGRHEQLWSFGPLGLQLWNSTRAVDFLQSLPDVDPENIGGTGASGGATQLILLSAVDPRIKFSSPVNMISSIMQGGSPCENTPNLRVGTNNMEIGAMMAPRPMFMVAATGDWTRNTPRVEYPAVRSIYELYDATANLEMTQITAPHNYNKETREAVYRYFGPKFAGVTNLAELKERNLPVEPLQDMMVWDERTLPGNALAYQQIFDEWIAAAKRQDEATTNPSDYRLRLTYALGADWPAHVLSETEGGKMLLGREGRGDRVQAIETGPNPQTIVVHPDGAEAARGVTSEPALLITAFQTGPSVAPRDRSEKFFLTFNKSDDAERVQDILTALAYLAEKGVR
ncbi:MAG: alpha/beta hydrolase family protein, partial [Bryobacteraceae bacterium]